MSDRDTYWQTYIDLYLTKKSSQTQTRFCEEQSLPKDRFKYHYRRLHLKSINNKDVLLKIKQYFQFYKISYHPSFY